MGSVKSYIHQQEMDERRHEWIEEQVDFNIGPGDAEWEEMEKLYDKRLRDGTLYEPQMAWDLEEEIEWSKGNPHSVAFNDFCSQIFRLNQLMGESEDPMQQKIRFSYAVTLMESCLSEMLKSITLSSPELQRSAIINVHGLKDATIKVNSLLGQQSSDVIEKTIISHLSSIIYHNIDSVLKIYRAILNAKIDNLPDGIIGKIKEATDLRHDIVHRNGKKANGEVNEITKEIVNAHIEQINTFMDCVFEFINKNYPQPDF